MCAAQGGSAAAARSGGNTEAREWAARRADDDLYADADADVALEMALYGEERLETEATRSRGPAGARGGTTAADAAGEQQHQATQQKKQQVNQQHVPQQRQAPQPHQHQHQHQQPGRQQTQGQQEKQPAPRTEAVPDDDGDYNTEGIKKEGDSSFYVRFSCDSSVSRAAGLLTSARSCVQPCPHLFFFSKQSQQGTPCSAVPCLKASSQVVAARAWHAAVWSAHRTGGHQEEGGRARHRRNACIPAP
eukprot:363280-Chlamydomonas_euryale.AAC.14